MSHPAATLISVEKHLVERFSQRDCEQLAVAVSNLTGWPTVVVSDGQHDPDNWFDHYAAYLYFDHRHDADWDGTDSEIVVVDRLDRIGMPSTFLPDDETIMAARALVSRYGLC